MDSAERSPDGRGRTSNTTQVRSKRSPQPRAARTWTAFGESKTAKQWAADPRCTIAYGTLYQRLRTLKMPPEQAIARSLRDVEQFEALGERKSIYQWSQDPTCAVTYSGLADRVKDGVPMQDALTRAGSLLRRPKVGRRYTAFGEERTLKEWAADPRCMVSATLVRKRMAAGLSPEAAILAGGLSRKGAKQYEAFGVRMALHEWVRDPRCRCSFRTLVARLKTGMTFPLALVDPSTTGAQSGSVKLEAFGESRSLGDWARDPRCLVPEYTLRHRTRRGLPLQQAMTTPAEGPSYAAFGETKTVEEWLRDPRAAIVRGTLMNRLMLGEPFEEALTRPPKPSYRPPRTYAVTISGETKSITEWSKDPRCKISESALRKRIREGMPPEQALSASFVNAGHATYRAFGEDKILEQWARDPRCLVPRGTLRQRIFNGEPCETAMMRPSMRKLRPIWEPTKSVGHPAMAQPSR